MPPSARAVWFRSARVVDVDDVPLPPLGEGDVLVRSLYSGISTGTELLAYRGEIDPELVLDETIEGMEGTFAYPFRYGYSCVGHVEESRSGIAAGTLVFALHPHQDVFVAPAADVVPLDEGSDPRVATLFPMVETALQVSLDAGAVAHDVVVVSGLGPVGLLVALLLQRAAALVLAADPVPWRREAASSLGLVAVDPSELGGRVAAASNGQGAPLLVEVSGNPVALVAGLDLLAHEGTALVASWYGTKEVDLPLGGAFHRRRLTIRSTQVSTIPAALSVRWTLARRRQVARSLLGQLPLAALATHEFGFLDAPSAFAALDRSDEGLLHAALRYE